MECLGVAMELGDGAGVAYCLEGIASLVATDTKPERRARLFGRRKSYSKPSDPLYVQVQDRDVYNSAVEELRSRLGEEAFETAWAEGRAMPPEQAVENALKPPLMPEEPNSPPASATVRSRCFASSQAA